MYPNCNGFESISKEVITVGKCCFCGACASACPNGNVRLGTEKPEVVGQCPENCNICWNSCPYGINNKLLDNVCETNNTQYYLGRLHNKEAMDYVASGGAITGILTCLLEQKKVDAVIVTQFGGRTPWAPNPVLTNSSEMILKAAYPKYALSPTLGLIKNIADENYESVAFMGLPCHIEAIRIMQRTVREYTEKIAKAIKSIKYTIGIWCGNNFNELGTREFISSIGINPGDVDEVRYERVNQSIVFSVTAKGQKFQVPFGAYLGYLLSKHIAPVCSKCTRCYADYADLSIGGMNNPSLRWSGIFAQTNEGREALKLAVDNNYIEIKDMSDSDISNLMMKKEYKKFMRRV